MYKLIRIAALSGRVKPGDPSGCRKLLAQELQTAVLHRPNLILLPADILLPPSAAALREQDYMLEQAE